MKLRKCIAFVLLLSLVPSAHAVPPAVADASVSRSGSLLFLRADSPVTTIEASPTVTVDGAAVPLNPQRFWANPSRRFTWVCYQLQTPVKPGQVVTYSAPDGFLTTASGPALAIPDGSPVNNQSGAPAPVPAAYTMRVGANHSPSPAAIYSTCPIGQDLSVRFSPGAGTSLKSWPTPAGADSWISSSAYSKLGIAAGPTVWFEGRGAGAIATCTVVGGSIQSIQVSSPGAGYSATTQVWIVGGGGGAGATATCTVVGESIASVAVTSGGQGYSDGVYTVQWDDSAPKAGIPTTKLVLYDSSAGGPLLYVTPLPARSSAGINVKGVLYGVTSAYYVQYRPTSAYSHGAAIGMGFRGGAGAAPGPYTNTAVNWIATGPGNVPNRNNPVAPDQSVASWCDFGPTLRFMDCTLPGGAVSNAVDPADVQSLGDLTCSGPAIYRTASVVVVRPHLKATSPNIFVNGMSSKAVSTPGGLPTPYALPALADGIPNWLGSNTQVSAEFVTSKPHGLATYQLFWSHVAPTNKLAIVNAKGETASVVMPQYECAVYVTGPNTFATLYGGPPGGPWNAAADQPNVATPFDVGITLRSGGAISYDTAAGFSAALPGGGCWVNVPAAASDALVASIVRSVARWLPPGRKIWVEYGNETWNAGFPSYNYFGTLGFMSGRNPATFYADRAANVHNLAFSVLDGMGRGGDLVRVFGSFAGVPQVTADIINYANANAIKVDAVAIAPYWVIPDDRPFRIAFASVVSSHPKSVAVGTAWPWTRAMAHELLQNMLAYDATWTGPGGLLAGHRDLMSTYKGGPPPALVGYEGGIQNFVPNGTGVDTVTLQRDLFYDPGMYDTMNSYFSMCQAGGLSELCYFQLASDFSWTFSWNLATNSGQSPGRGDGSDGMAVNRFWMESNTVPGASGPAPAYSGTWDRFNVSPSLAAWRDWGRRAKGTN